MHEEVKFPPSASLKRKLLGPGFLTLLVLAICCCASPSCKSASKEKTTLRVNLFPYLPDAAGDGLKGMAARIKQEFEKQNPSVNLEVTLSTDNDFYDLANYKKWMNSFDLIEPDTLFLTDLVAPEELIEEWGNASESEWQPPARNAAKVNGKVYAIPHWMCGYFLFSRDPRIAKAENLKDLVAILQATHGSIPEVAGNLFSSWDTPAIYLDSWENNHSPANPRQAISISLDAETMQALKEFSDQCNWGGKNPCLDKTYKDNTLAQRRFAKEEVETAFGFSESLFDILKAASSGHSDRSIILSTFVVGKGNHPLLFMDGFVMPKGRSKEVKAAAAAFVRYMQRPETYTWIVMSQDAPGAPGRYLTPATISAFALEPIKSNLYYRAIQATISKGSNFPNSGLPELHTEMRDAIISKLQSPK
jgi:thiamine pyridinylase